MSILQKWGLGAVLTFDADKAVASMSRAKRAVTALREGLGRVGEGGGRMAAGLGQVGLVLAPIAAGLGLAGYRASGLAADLEGQMLTMRVLLGDANKAQVLIDKLRANAAKTPFEEGEIIESSKRLLRLTGDNIDRNLEMLGVMETMAALNPTKNLTDATEALLDASSGGGFERLKEFGISMSADDFAAAGRPGGKAWADAVFASLQSEMTRLTRGEDLVGALSQTFSGRMSTFGDVFNGILREVGRSLNREIGPLLGPIGDRITAALPDILAGVEMVIGGIRGAVATARPYLEELLAFWDGLGGEGRAKVVAFVLGLATLATVLLPLGGVIGSVVVVVGGLVSAFTALWPIVAGIFGALSPEIVVGVGAALAAAAIAAGLLFGTFREAGEGPLDFIMRLGGEGAAAFVSGIRGMRIAAEAFFAPLVARVLPALGAAWERLEWPLRSLAGKLDYMQSLMFTPAMGEAISFWDGLGWIIGGAVVTGIELAAGAMEWLIGAFSVMLDYMGPIHAFFGNVVELFFAIVSGSLEAGTATNALLAVIGSGIGALVAQIFLIVTMAVEGLVRFIAATISTIPGAKSLFGENVAGAFGADAISRFRTDLSENYSSAISDVNFQYSDRAKAQAEANSPTVVAQAGAVKNEVTVKAELKMDGKEVARAAGGAAVRAGERGQGPQMPAQQRGKVLRSGLQVTPLRPTEVF